LKYGRIKEGSYCHKNNEKINVQLNPNSKAQPTIKMVKYHKSEDKNFQLFSTAGLKF